MTPQPGPELDKLVCEIMGMPPCGEREVGYRHDGRPGFGESSTACTLPHYVSIKEPTYPPVSTSWVACEPVIEWLYQNTTNLRYWFSEQRFGVDDYPIRFPSGNTMAHAACLAVLAIDRRGRKPRRRSDEPTQQNR